jgi:hypothetical protein
MREFRLFTTSQLMIYQDHKSESQSYDTVSMFGMHPLELVGVFQQTKSYICLCYVEQGKIISDADHAILLNTDIRKCRWVTLLSKCICIRINAIDKVLRLVDSNLAYLDSPGNMNGSRTLFYCQSNQVIKTLFAFTRQMMRTSTKMTYSSSMSIQKISSTMMVCRCLLYLFL